MHGRLDCGIHSFIISPSTREYSAGQADACFVDVDNPNNIMMYEWSYAC